ncbi:MAG: ABC transporter ATP-binding protein [Bacteroidota bacterium]|jgi:iron complex transport system ATP-binding protein|nr:ABC transporter ATP-binding protein [Bacteroidota bacterium]
MKPFLEIEDLACGYPGGFQVEGIHLALPEGAFAGIIGPNGSGKTTLFRGITGTLPLMKGRVRLDGADLSMLTWKEKAQIMAIVSQFSETASMTVEEYVLMGRLPYRRRFQFFDTKEDIETAHQVMRLTNTYRLRSQPMNELSGGERQMAHIACALSQHPRLLLLDEPTSHLDITHQMQFMNLIQRLNEEMRLTVIMILHDLSLAAEYCDYLLMMKEGFEFCQGTPEEVITYQHIESVYQTAVIVNTNPISGKPVVFPVSERWLTNGAK